MLFNPNTNGDNDMTQQTEWEHDGLVWSKRAALIRDGRERAFWYVCGFQDGAAESTETQEAWEFGRHYGVIFMEFYTDQRGTLPNLPREFARWRNERTPK
jgi:hypothetical protein